MTNQEENKGKQTSIDSAQADKMIIGDHSTINDVDAIKTAFLDIVKEFVPENDKRRAIVENNINRLNLYLEELKELKELHHYLDTILLIFDQLMYQVKTYATKKRIYKNSSLRPSWEPVYNELTKLIRWAKKDAKYPGQQLFEDEDGNVSGVEALVLIDSEFKEISNMIFEIEQASRKRNQSRMGIFLRQSSISLIILGDRLSDFKSDLRLLMNETDQQLRNKAIELYEFSKETL